MPLDFHKEMDKYLANKRRKRLFSNIKSKVMNKKAVLSYKTASKFGELKGKLTSEVEEIKKKKKEQKIKLSNIPEGHKKSEAFFRDEKGLEKSKTFQKDFPTSKSGDFEEPEKEITQEEIKELVEEKGSKKLEEKIEPIKEEEKEGWKEIKLEEPQDKRGGLGYLKEEKKKLQENLVKIQKKEKEEKGKLVKLSEENEQRSKVWSEEDKLKKLELEEEIRILKEKERIEEERLAELRGARRREQMGALRGRVKDILFKKKPKISKDMVEEVRKEVRREAKVKEAERQRVKTKELDKPKEEVTKAEEQSKEEKTRGIVPNISSALEIIFGKPQHHQAKLEVSQAEVEKKGHKPKKSFFSNFIQIKTGAQIAKEEGERLKQEEEQALKDQSKINKIFQGEGEVKTNMPTEEQSINISTLFPDETIQQKSQNQKDIIELGQDYKIKVVKN